jgi:hypothetical protein
MKVVSVTIVEVPGRGWLHKETGRTYKTAAGAFRAVLRDARRFNQSVAHVVTWLYGGQSSQQLIIFACHKNTS